jgi:hypothetical protein
MDECVGTGLERPARLAFALDMDTDRQPVAVSGAYDCTQRGVVKQRMTAVQHQFDQVVPVGGRLVDRAYAVRRSPESSD